MTVSPTLAWTVFGLKTMFSIVTAVEVPAEPEPGVLDAAAGAGVELAAELELELADTCQVLPAQEKLSAVLADPAAAVREADPNILLTNYLTPESRMMIRRNVRARGTPTASPIATVSIHSACVTSAANSGSRSSILSAI